MFDVKYSNQAIKFLKKSDKVLRQRLVKKVEELRNEPFPSDVKSIEGFKEKLFRVRVGDYRILYELDHQLNLVGIVKIDHRKRIY